ncbi:hypothetical protein [Moraxella nasibovis]|nr:hypothetical protein [Moraxella nasibovis]
MIVLCAFLYGFCVSVWCGCSWLGRALAVAAEANLPMDDFDGH